MPSEPTRFNGRCKVLILGAMPHTRRDLSPFLTRHFPLATTVDLNGAPAPREMSAALQCQVPVFCFTEVGKAGDGSLGLIADLLRFDAKLGIIAILQPNEHDMILGCLRAGASDFMIPPFTTEQFDSAVQKLVKLSPQVQSTVTPAKIYCVIPAKGACGATTVACDLVYQWKRLGASRLLLADLDPITGVASFLLKIKSQFSFVDVLQRAADMDADLWKAMVTNRQGVDVLLAPESLADGALAYKDAGPILDYARYNYDVAVLDAGSAYGDWTLSQATLSDEVLLVITNELASLQSAQRVLKYLESNGVGQWKIRLIVNRYDRHAGLSEDVISQALQMEICHLLPNDYPTVQKALLEGKPIPASSAFGKSMATLAERLAGREEPNKKASSLAGLLSLFSRTSS